MLEWDAIAFPCVNTAAAAAKLLQSCPTLCDPIDGSPPGSPIPGILQARTLEWVAISFSREDIEAGAIFAFSLWHAPECQCPLKRALHASGTLIFMSGAPSFVHVSQGMLL